MGVFSQPVMRGAAAGIHPVALSSELCVPGFAPGQQEGAGQVQLSVLDVLEVSVPLQKERDIPALPSSRLQLPWAAAVQGMWGCVPAQSLARAGSREALLLLLPRLPQGPAALLLPQALLFPAPCPEDEIVSMADSTTTMDDIEGELFRIERIREILVRRESELRYMMDDIQLCQEISRLKTELQKLLDLPENQKSNEEKQREEQLVQQIHKLVETRDFLVDDVEFERLREREEDKEMAEFLQSKLSKSCLQRTTPVPEKKMTSRGQQTSAPYVTKTGLALLRGCCGFTCSIM
uniref:BMERB domain-containing protein n=1 Tax=Zonotrichia albicollis TaxID=44394 RepID=A0A8D2MLZ2_ZONAL